MDLEVPENKMAYEKPKISYDAIRKNTTLGDFVETEEEEESKDSSS